MLRNRFRKDVPEHLNDHYLSYQGERSSWTENINRNPATTAELEFDPTLVWYTDVFVQLTNEWIATNFLKRKRYQ